MAESMPTTVDGGDSHAAQAPNKPLSPLAPEFVPNRNTNVDSSDDDSTNVTKSNNNSSGHCYTLPNLSPHGGEIDDGKMVTVLPAPDDQTTVLYSPGEDPFASFPRFAYAEGMHIGPTRADKSLLNFFSTVIQVLKYNRVRFENVATDVQTVGGGLNYNYYVLSNVMEQVFNESIMNAGFRFMGSKLLQLLCMLNPRENNICTGLFKKKLSHQHGMVELYMVTRQQAKARNTALFVTELCIQMHGVHETEQFVASALMQCLWPLVSKPRSANVECVCLALKTVGHDLVLLCNAALKQMVRALEELDTKDPGKHPMVRSVSNLLKFDWKRRSRAAKVVTQTSSDCNLKSTMNQGAADRKKSPADGPQLEGAAADGGGAVADEAPGQAQTLPTNAALLEVVIQVASDIKAIAEAALHKAA